MIWFLLSLIFVTIRFLCTTLGPTTLLLPEGVFKRAAIRHDPIGALPHSVTSHRYHSVPMLLIEYGATLRGYFAIKVAQQLGGHHWQTAAPVHWAVVGNHVTLFLSYYSVSKNNHPCGCYVIFCSPSSPPTLSSTSIETYLPRGHVALLDPVEL